LWLPGWSYHWSAGVLLPFVGVPFRPLDPAATSTGSLLVGLVTVILGGLVYRDIVRREQRLR